MTKRPDDPNAPPPGKSGKNPQQPPPVADDDNLELDLPPNAVEGSGVSVIDWASLVVEESVGEGEQPIVESPSAANLLPEEMVSEEVVELPTTMPVPPSSKVAATQAAFDLDEAISFEEEIPVVSGDSAIDLGADAVVEEVSAASGSAIELGADALIEEEAVAVPDSAIDLGADAVIEEAISGSGSAIDLGDDALIEEEEVAHPASSVNLAGRHLQDASGSAIDLGATASEIGAPSGSAVDLGADATSAEILLPASGSAIDLSDMSIEEPVVDADSAIDLTDAVVEVEESEELVDLGSKVKKKERPSGSAIDLGDAEHAEEAMAAGSELNLTGRPMADLDPEDVVNLDDAGEDSGIDLQDLVPASEGGSSVALTPGESGIDLFAEDVILEEPISASAGGSSRDLIAEALESGVNLLGKQKPKAQASDDALDDFLSKVGDGGDPSSSVDLGSVHTIDLHQAKSGSDSEVRLDEIGASPDEIAEIDLGTVDEVADLNDTDGVDLDALAETDGIDLSSATPEPNIDDIDINAIEDTPASDDIDIESLVGAETDASAEAEADEDEDEKPKKKVAAKDDDEDEVAEVKKGKKKEKTPGRSGAWVGGTMMGALLATAACATVWIGGVAQDDWRDQAREMVGMEKMAKAPVNTGVPQQQQPAITFAQTSDKIKSGDIDKVTDAELAQIDANDAAQLHARADLRWTKYLRDKRGKNLKGDDEPVKQAMEDLNKAVEKGNADALLLRGEIHNMTGNKKQALEDFKKGAEQFKGEPNQKERFEAAIVGIEVQEKIAHLLPRNVPAHVIAMALVMLQNQNPPQPQPDNKAPDEAGFSFWKAIKAVRENNYAEAIKFLDEARTRHDERRFVLPKKQQNPLSDPREDIFLRACDDLKEFWSLRARLKNKDYLTLAADDKGRIAEVDVILKQVGDAQVKDIKDAGEKLYKEKVKDKPAEKVEDLVKLATDERKEKDDAITDLKKTGGDQKKMIETINDDLKKTKEALTASNDKLTAAEGREGALKKGIESLGVALNMKVADAQKDMPKLLTEVKELSKLADRNFALEERARMKKQISDEQARVVAEQQKVAEARAVLKDRWEPAQMLPFWLAVLQADRSRTDLHPSALVDVRRVLSDTMASDADRGRALAIEGLVQRNEDKFSDSAATLGKSRESLISGKATEWVKVVDSALKEVQDPGATFARRTADLLAQNKNAEALATLKKGLELVPEDKRGPLYARRAQIAFDLARSKGPIEKNDPAITGAQKDAEAAAGAGVAEGHYLLGRIAEDMGQASEAVKNYDAAATAAARAKQTGEELRYKAAKAKALLRVRVNEKVTRQAPQPDLRPQQPEEQTEQQDQQPNVYDQSCSATDIARMLAVLITFTLQEGPAPALPQTGPNVKEAEKLADEIIKLGDKAPFDALATAWAVKGLYTRALDVYLKGLRDNNHLAPGYANGLLDLVKSHPQLKRPESLAIPDPTAGEKAYSAGLVFFAKKQYATAEREFLSAVENDNTDARYYYFLGLSRMAQGKREAVEDFDAGAQLERLGRPDRAAVSQALERIQGPMRKKLNDIRTLPSKSAPK